MLKTKNENSTQSRYQEIVSDLAQLSEWELRSFCLSESECSVIQVVLEYKQSEALNKLVIT